LTPLLCFIFLRTAAFNLRTFVGGARRIVWHLLIYIFVKRDSQLLPLKAFHYPIKQFPLHPKAFVIVTPFLPHRPRRKVHLTRWNLHVLPSGAQGNSELCFRLARQHVCLEATVHRSRVGPCKECESCGNARFRERK
jgi:hypothetical protein